MVSAVSPKPTADPTGIITGFASATGDCLPLACTLNAWVLAGGDAPPVWRAADTETFEAEPVTYTWHTSTTDRRIVPDPDAPPLWARFYDLETSEPFLANRDGKRVATLAEVQRERRTGYDWYGSWPAELLARDYPAWKARLGPRP